MSVFTFRAEPNGPVVLTVEAEVPGDALMEANEKLVWSGRIKDFYAWNDEVHPGDFSPMFGAVWD